ncbi:hypothetical protein AX14_000682 [Amanita brunnescens Koide BX004]|nr:hypothetical protein AX14_000682 [Amanita brunnescens Koide BX004]
MHLSLDQQLDGTARTASGQDNDRLRRTGRWSIVPNGLADLNSVVLKSEAEIGDIKRTRTVEEHAGRLMVARKFIMKDCEEYPKSEDVWLEASRLHHKSDAKVILAQAVQHVWQSIKTVPCHTQ